ncbi:hypothetical protein GW931_03145 [archaeon]|nr:hypothetical protein [archaeon]
MGEVIVNRIEKAFSHILNRNYLDYEISEGNKIVIQTKDNTPLIVMEINSKDIEKVNSESLEKRKTFPFTRFGIISSELTGIPKNFFTEGKNLDFFQTINTNEYVEEVLLTLIKEELDSIQLIFDISDIKLNEIKQ